MVSTRSNKNKTRTPLRGRGSQSLQKKVTARNKNKAGDKQQADHGAWPENAHKFAEDKATQESEAQLKRELFAATRNQ